jgi:hypothetical protein
LRLFFFAILYKYDTILTSLREKRSIFAEFGNDAKRWDCRKIFSNAESGLQKWGNQLVKGAQPFADGGAEKWQRCRNELQKPCRLLCRNLCRVGVETFCRGWCRIRCSPIGATCKQDEQVAPLEPKYHASAFAEPRAVHRAELYAEICAEKNAPMQKQI